jgi:hypothetical protein
MKKILLTIIIGFTTLTSYSQVVADKQLNSFVEYLRTKNVSDEEINKMVSGLIENPDLYNNLWKNFIDQAIKSDSTKWKFLNDLNMQFKTFQATDNQPTALGLTYDFNFDYAKFSEKDNYRNSHSFGLTARGNIAFNKNLNPTDFLETKVNYRWSQFFGGVIKSKDQTAVFTRLNSLEDKLVNITDMQSKEAIALWNEFSNHLVLSNQYYYSLAPKFALESNQDFSKTQFTPGLMVDLSAKAWKKNSTLSYFNVFDYPFALLRLITGTDKEFTVYGSTIPTVQLGFDYVIPTNDTIRENLTGNIDPFSRIKFETSFRTFITRVKKENLFFNANYRYYQELNAPETITTANLGTHSYFVMALQTTSGFYVSYANGKLPFDAKSDEVYSIGFNYKFN